MKKEERLNALEVALANETREREFYLKSAERCRNPLGKSMFKQFSPHVSGSDVEQVKDDNDYHWE